MWNLKHEGKYMTNPNIRDKKMEMYQNFLKKANYNNYVYC